MREFPDLKGRLDAFEWLTRRRFEHGEAIRRSELENVDLGDRTITMVGPSGIWKPAGFELPLSVSTVIDGPYPDVFDSSAGTVEYRYRNSGPNHWNNSGLRRAQSLRVPIVYFFPIERGVYTALYPTFVVGDDQATSTFTLQVDDLSASLDRSASDYDPGETARRAYVTRTVQQRVHQVAFRERVVKAYQERCALCSLRHQELLDAAHITPDKDPEGEPVVSNGLALCKLHHAAFDRAFFAIRPDYEIEVRPSLLKEKDGPMLVVGLQQIHGRTINVPARHKDRPDPARLERRYELFLRAG